VKEVADWADPMVDTMVAVLAAPMVGQWDAATVETTADK